jgi:multiple sugar transport system permease protein
VALGFLFVYPIGRLVEMSLTDLSLTSPAARFIGLRNFLGLLGDPVAWTALTNTAAFTIASVALHLCLGLALALLLTQRIHPAARGVFRGILILPWMFTAVVVAIDWRLILHPFGVLNGTLTALHLENPAAPIDWLGTPALAMPALVLVNLWRGYPVVMLMLLAGLQTIPGELLEASATDGAAWFAQLRHIVLPGLRPIIISVALLDTIWNARLFDLVFLTTGGGPLGRTQVLATYVYRLAFESFQLGTAAALSLVVVLLTLTLAIAYMYQRPA